MARPERIRDDDRLAVGRDLASVAVADLEAALVVDDPDLGGLALVRDDVGDALRRWVADEADPDVGAVAEVRSVHDVHDREDVAAPPATREGDEREQDAGAKQDA